MRYTLVLCLLLAACKHAPDTGLATPVQIPDLPPNLAQKAGPLPDLTDPTMGGLVRDGVQSDMQYNSVSHQLNNVIDLYNCIKTSINTKKEIKCQ